MVPGSPASCSGTGKVRRRDGARQLYRIPLIQVHHRPVPLRPASEDAAASRRVLTPKSPARGGRGRRQQRIWAFWARARRRRSRQERRRQQDCRHLRFCVATGISLAADFELAWTHALNSGQLDAWSPQQTLLLRLGLNPCCHSTGSNGGCCGWLWRLAAEETLSRRSTSRLGSRTWAEQPGRRSRFVLPRCAAIGHLVDMGGSARAGDRAGAV